MAFETSPQYPDGPENLRQSDGYGRLQFIRELIAKDGRELCEAFGLQNDTSRGDAELLRHTSAALEMLDVEATIGLVLRHVGEADGGNRHEPLTKLGWVALEPFVGAAGGYIVRPTESGIAVLDGLRSASGQLKAAEERTRHRMAYREQVEAIKARRSVSPSG